MATTANVGRAMQIGVVTCLTLPAGTTIAKPSSGFVLAGRHCWSRKVLVLGAKVTYVIYLKADRRLAANVQLNATAAAKKRPCCA